MGLGHPRADTDAITQINGQFVLVSQSGFLHVLPQRTRCCQESCLSCCSPLPGMSQNILV
ncbi:unnamed protein product, partial [Vitis vinifera]